MWGRRPHGLASPVPVGHTVDMGTTRMALAVISLLGVAGGVVGCQTARGHVDAGRIEQGCLAVERAPSPLIDDDGPALASRIRHRLDGTIRVRPVPHDELQTLAGAGVFVGEHPDLIEVSVAGDGLLDLRSVELVDVAGTRLTPLPVGEALALALVGAPHPPEPVVRSSTHTPGPFEALIKMVAIATVGVPLSIVSLGIIPPDLGGALDPNRTTTSTWTEDHPALAAWRAREDVVAAARLGAFFGVGGATCASGRCRRIVSVARADVWRQARLTMVLTAGECALDDTVTVDVGPGTTAFRDTAPDDGQWGRFWDEGLGLRPIVEDVGSAVEDCGDCLCGSGC